MIILSKANVSDAAGAAAPAQVAKASLARFHELRLQAATLLNEAARLPLLPDLHLRQAEASAAIAGIRFHRVHGHATGDDALAVRDDLEAIARRVDPLIAAIGDIAMEEFGADRSNFADVLFNALSDNAGPHLSVLADKIAEDNDEALNDARHPGSHSAALRQEA